MPKLVDHNRYRRELLGQCLALFAQQGYGSITMRQIARGLGVSTGTLYHYFPSKEEVFIQLVQELCEKDIANFFAQAPMAKTTRDRLQAVMAFFLANYRFYQQQVFLWVDFYQHNQRQAAHQSTGKSVDEAREVDDRSSNNLLWLQRFWRQTRDQLVMYLQLPTEQVDFILIFMDGLLLQCLYEHGPEEGAWIEQQSQRLVQLLAPD